MKNNKMKKPEKTRVSWRLKMFLPNQKVTKRSEIKILFMLVGFKPWSFIFIYMLCLKYLQFSFKSAYCNEKYCGLMCHPYNVLRKGKIFLSTFVGMRRGEERQTASHWLEEKMRGKVKSKKRLLLKGTVRYDAEFLHLSTRFWICSPE